MFECPGVRSFYLAERVVWQIADVGVGGPPVPVDPPRFVAIPAEATSSDLAAWRAMIPYTDRLSAEEIDYASFARERLMGSIFVAPVCIPFSESC